MSGICVTVEDKVAVWEHLHVSENSFLANMRDLMAWLANADEDTWSEWQGYSLHVRPAHRCKLDEGPLFESTSMAGLMDPCTCPECGHHTGTNDNNCETCLLDARADALSAERKAGSRC